MRIKSFLILLAVSIIQSCIPIQKSVETNNSVKEYNGSIITKNAIKTPEYKNTSASSTKLKINKLILKQNSFKRELSKLLVQIINDTLIKQPGISTRLNLVKIKLAPQDLKAFQKEEYYEIDFQDKQITIGAISVKGIINGLASLEYELTQSNKSLKEIKDWPSMERRIMQVTLKSMDPNVVKQVLLRLWRGHFNGALYSIHNSVEFDAYKEHCLKDAMSKEDFKSICEFGNLFNLEAIPHFAFLSHQDKSFIQEAISPELLYNSKTLDPRNPEIYTLIFAVINEVEALIKPKIIHIGHDEVVGFNEKQTEEFGPILPAELFLFNVKKINNYLQSKNIEIWMWGDMLVAADDFPKMHPGYLHATPEYKSIIDSLPKNVVICYWYYMHYKVMLKKKLDFSAVDYFLKKGFQVLGATYNVNEMTEQFSDYVIEKNDPNFNGMIATCWHKLLDGTTRYKKSNDQLKQFDEILEYSANAYWNAK